MKTITGTCHFVSLNAAQDYYRPYGDYSAAAITDKIYRGEIYIGRPKVKKGQSLFEKDGRWHICS